MAQFKSKIYLNLEQASELTGLGIPALRRRVREGSLEAFWVDGRTYVLRYRDLERIVESRRGATV